MDRIALGVLLGYVIGSFPTAYLLVRWKSRMDIRNAGSGNVGTVNSFLVTRSWVVGGAVLTVDLVKGMCATALGTSLGGGTAIAGAAAGVATVLGHNYPVWLRFHGGRGLAPAAGAVLIMQWLIVPLWCLAWLCSFAALRSVNPANALASMILLVLAAGVPPEYSSRLLGGADITVLRGFTIILMGLILLRHVEPVRDFFAGRKEKWQ